MAKTIALSVLLAGGKTPADLHAARADRKVESNVQTLVAIANWDKETNTRIVQEFVDLGFDGIQTDKRAGRYDNVRRVKACEGSKTLSTTVRNLQKDISSILFYAVNANDENRVVLSLWDICTDADDIYSQLQELSGGFMLDGRDAYLTSDAAKEADESKLVGLMVVVEDTLMEAAKNRRKLVGEYAAAHPMTKGETVGDFQKRIRAHYKTTDNVVPDEVAAGSTSFDPTGITDNAEAEDLTPAGT